MHTISDFEDIRGIFLVLSIIAIEGPANLSNIKDSSRNTQKLGTNAIRTSVNNLLEMKLIKGVPGSRFSERRVALSEKGKKLIPLLNQINEILQEEV